MATEKTVEKLEQQIKELTDMVKTMLNNKTYKTPACQRRASREYYARNKDTMEMKIKSAINNRKRRDRRILILKQQRENQDLKNPEIRLANQSLSPKGLSERKEHNEQPNNTPIFLGY